MGKEYYKSEIIRIISEMDNADTTASIYSFIMGLLSVRKSGNE